MILIFGFNAEYGSWKISWISLLKLYLDNPSIILLSGLQGSGKTTFGGKLANYLKKKKGKNPLLVACDVYRPAAIDQLKLLGSQINVDVYTEDENKDPVVIAKNSLKFAK